MIYPGRAAFISMHTSPLAELGSDKAGGMNVYIRDLCRELGKRGWHIDVFTRAKSAEYSQIEHDPSSSGIRVIHIPAGPFDSLSPAQHAPYTSEFAQGILEFTDRNNLLYDIIHSHYWLSGLTAIELKDAWGIPFAQMFHTLGRMKNRIANNTAGREPDVRIESERKVIYNADRIIAATPAERIQLLWLYHADPKKIRINPPGVDVHRFCPQDQQTAREKICMDQEARLLLFVGRLEPLKGIDTLLKAISHLDANGSAIEDICITIIGGSGNDKEMRRLKEMTNDLQIERRVSFLGARDQDKLPTFYSAADAVIMPSHYESFGMVALEAMACGTPVIASEVGGLAYLVQDGITGYRVPTQDSQALAEKISLLLGSTDLRAQMSEAAAQHAMTYRWEIIAEKMLAIYEEMLRLN